ncbi:MAG: pyridoxine 5'-phosphate synthase [Gammaproteobacteria bacterium]|nr:MAG: pyridoxine 5'-phosphate synthase [Gammaproteobacteria bacterium]
MSNINEEIKKNNSTIYLGVNIDHVATLRQARGTDYPQVFHAALLAEQAGADGITIHLREDRRHIHDRDVELVKEVINSRLNLEMAVTDEMILIAKKINPEYVCLVPEKREEVTTEGGLDVAGNYDKVKKACDELGAQGIKVSLFIDAEEEQIKASKDVGAPFIELHTGKYADAETPLLVDEEFETIVRGVSYGKSIGLTVNAGHGLHYHNTARVAAIPDIYELNIGHSIISRAVFTGLEKAVSDMKKIMIEARR